MNNKAAVRQQRMAQGIFDCFPINPIKIIKPPAMDAKMENMWFMKILGTMLAA